jgi:hypothetical protein
MPPHLRSLKEAIWFSLSIGVLFLTGALSCVSWAHSRGAYGSAFVAYPAKLASESSTTARFSVPYKGDYELQIWYSRKETALTCDDLDGIVGKATLFNGNGIVKELSLPVRHHTGDGDGCAMILLTTPMEPAAEYSFVFQIERMPEKFARVQATVKAEHPAEYNYLFLLLDGVAAVLVLGSVICTFFAVRWWRIVRAAPPDHGNQL